MISQSAYHENCGKVSMPTKRDDDIKLLESVLDEDLELTEEEQIMFDGLLDFLKGSPSRSLSKKQRNKLQASYDRSHPEYENLYSSGKVPKGKDIPTPPVLQNLPKFPPGRRS